MSGMNRRVFLRPCALGLVCLSLGCHLLNLAPAVPDRVEADPLAAAPKKHGFRLSQYFFRYDFELKHNLPLFRELADLRDQVFKELQLPPSNVPIQVYIFENRDRYERFMSAKYPDLPRRRAFFVAQAHTVGGPEDLLVYTYWGERLKEDLRHELTHALLHSVLRDVPLWLDEGLAEYFEVPPECKGTHYQHLNEIRRGPGEAFKPDLARLERLSQVAQMAPAEYRESWAWVHLMLRDRPEAKAVLLGYLRQLRTSSSPGLLGPRLAAVIPQPNEALANHLARLDSGISPAPTAQR